MEEQLVSQEVYCKALRRGFDIKSCRCGGHPDCICGDFRPTQSLLQKWLRDKFKIHIEIGYRINNEDEYYYCLQYRNGFNVRVTTWNYCFESYEESLESGLKEALKIINQKPRGVLKI